MIRNLNPISFRSFGSVVSERSYGARTFEKTGTVDLRIACGDVVVYRACGETFLSMSSGMGVLSVSSDGENFQSFYLDKQVRVQPGVRFSLVPFVADAAVKMAADVEPEQLGTRPADSLRTDHQLRVEGI